MLIQTVIKKKCATGKKVSPKSGLEILNLDMKELNLFLILYKVRACLGRNDNGISKPNKGTSVPANRKYCRL